MQSRLLMLCRSFALQAGDSLLQGMWRDTPAYLGVIIDEKRYFMGAYRIIYIQSGIDVAKFQMLGDATLQEDHPATGVQYRMTDDREWESQQCGGKTPISMDKSSHLKFNSFFGDDTAGGDGIVFVLQARGNIVIENTEGHFL